MAKEPVIPEKTKKEIDRIIAEFNKANFSGSAKDVAYFPEFKGKYLYLKRHEYGKISPVARLTYTGNFKKWEFAIFKWTREGYDPDEFFFPGMEHVDGTIKGAMKAGLTAYPV